MDKTSEHVIIVFSLCTKDHLLLLWSVCSIQNIPYQEKNTTIILPVTQLLTWFQCFQLAVSMFIQLEYNMSNASLRGTQWFISRTASHV